jgi:hypothetical protein
MLNDFYVEVTARPGLCRGEDEYGLLVRATAVSDYRIVLSCSGSVRFERTVHTRIEEVHMLHGAVPSGDAPPGAPGQVRIGASASGSEFQLFLNERFQFRVVDANYSGGLVGAFARSAGDTAMTVSFNDLTISAIEAGG